VAELAPKSPPVAGFYAPKSPPAGVGDVDPKSPVLVGGFYPKILPVGCPNKNGLGSLGWSKLNELI